MKVYKILLGFVAAAGLTFCGSGGEAVGDYDYGYVRTEVTVGNPKVVLYEARVGDEPLREMRVYLHNGKDAIYIIVDSERETGKNSFVYKKKEFIDNFENLYRKTKYTFTNLEDAMNQAVSDYIEDALLPKKSDK